MFGVEAQDECGEADDQEKGSVACVLCEDVVVLEEWNRQYTWAVYPDAGNAAHLGPSIPIRRVHDPTSRVLFRRVVVNMLYLLRLCGNKSADVMLEHPMYYPSLATLRSLPSCHA